MGIQRTITELARQAVADHAAVAQLAAVLDQQLRNGQGHTLQRAMRAMPASPARLLLTDLVEQSATCCHPGDAADRPPARLFAIGLSIPGDPDYLAHPLRQRALLTALIDRFPEQQLVALDRLLPLPLAAQLPVAAVWQMTQCCAEAAASARALATLPARAGRSSAAGAGRWCVVGLLPDTSPSVPLLREVLPGCLSGGSRRPDIGPALGYFDLLRHERLRAAPLAVLDDLMAILSRHQIGIAELGVIVYRQLPDELRLAVFHLPSGTAMAGIRRSLEAHPALPPQPHVAAEVFSRAGFGMVRLMPDQPPGQPFLTLADLAPRRL